MVDEGWNCVLRRNPIKETASAEKRWNAGPCQRFFWAAWLKRSCTAVKLCECFYIAVAHNKQDYSRMKNGGAVLEVWILLGTSSVWRWKHSRSHFPRRRQRDKKYFNSFLDQYSRWKPRKTVIRVWRLSAQMRRRSSERVASFFGVTVQFSFI